MKKFIYVFVSIFVLASCEKDNSDIIDKKLLLGNWEKIEIGLTVICTDYLEFSANLVSIKEICSSSSSSSFLTYKLDGNKIIVNGEIWREIIYVSADLLKLHDSQGILQEYKKP